MYVMPQPGAVPQQSTLPDFHEATYSRAQHRPIESLAAFISPPLAAFGGLAEDCVKSCDAAYPAQAQEAQFMACANKCGEPQWYESNVVRGIAAAGGIAGSIAGAYHGYKRNDSVGWGIAWFFLGGWFWPITIPIMFAQGFGERKRG